MAACQHCSATESACQWRDGCCEYCNHIEGRDLNATDPAVTAAAEAIDGPGTAYLLQRGHVDIDDVARIVAAARPIIEVEVRERIAAEIEAATTGPVGRESGLRYLRSDIAARIARGQS